MAAVLTHNKNNLENIYFFLKEAKRMGIQVAGPDVNESQLDFTVNKVGTIRFGLSALKGVGEGPVENLMEERLKSGDFTSLLDMVKRLNLRTMNKRCLDSLVLGGALDSFKDVHRAQYFGISGKHETYIEACLKFGSVFQSRKESATVSLFGDTDENFMSEPEIPNTPPWTLIETLEKEREMTGIYLSGHPLDDYKSEVENFTNCTLLKLSEPRQGKLKLAAVVTDVKRKVDKKGNDMGNFTLLDYSGSYELVLFREDFQKFHHILSAGNVVYLEAAMQQRYMSEEYMLVIRDAKLLADVAQHMTDTLTIKIAIGDLDESMFQYLDKTFNRKTGKQKLKFLISDPGQGLEILMNSNERKANVDTEFLSELDKKGLLYTLS
jgi:DNA polymerase-3 subunit alpha